MSRNTRVELYAAIRRDARAGVSGREIQRKHGVGWRTVQAAVASAWPLQRAAYPTRASKLDAFKPVIDDILRADLDAPRKQRHTITRIVDRLRTEHGMHDVSYPVVRAYVATRRPEISIECGRGAPGAFVPQTHLPGREAEVDFGEIGVRLRGQLVACHLFSLRMSYSGKAVHRASATGGQEAFFEGHVHAFQVLGGVPAGKVRYDNLKAAVAQVIGFSRQRVETDRWVAFRSHFDLDAFYCQPGITGAHEKGGVEGDIGWFRRNHLVPVPEVSSLRELNDLIDDYDRADDDRRIGHRAHTVAESFSAEHQLLKPLPVEPFETGLWLTPRVDRYAQITVRTNRYSVPSRLIGRQVRVLLNASDLTVYDGRTPAATHERLLTKGGACLDLDHYLEAFVRKPGAFPGATALAQARAAGTFTAAHDAWWAAACKAHGDTAGTRALIEVLLLHRHTEHRHVVAGITAALHAGALTADAVALEARKAADAAQGVTAIVGPPSADPPSVASLTAHRLTRLPVDTRPPPSVTAYDQLLRRTTE
ncbi:IS21 family transposase [Mycobacterium sp. shizuoka-1]|uniref:IS21 family transposase n=1 Tax=Mycobacterium sp. shizuoka-1 TaxID=2039281 RepID=UPI000C06E795|nr:IS21 family transposase [Mycobacterium sp. shizuoka-1]